MTPRIDLNADLGEGFGVGSWVTTYDPTLPVLGLPGSALPRAAGAAGLHTVRGGFADRGYTPEGTLVPRREPGALLHEPARVAERARRGAVQLARAVREALEESGSVPIPFAT